MSCDYLQLLALIHCTILKETASISAKILPVFLAYLAYLVFLVGCLLFIVLLLFNKLLPFRLRTSPSSMIEETCNPLFLKFGDHARTVDTGQLRVLKKALSYL